MPFQSKAQESAAFAGGLGPKMKAAAPQWAAETPSQSALPTHKKKKKSNKVPSLTGLQK